jgi:glycerol-3-phosphate dehydrogenase
MNRDQSLRDLAQEEFDICIIGAGASGAGCALDAALRGYKVALIDRQDFASETSSKSTKLIHGGVRYLEQAFKKLDFAQLRQVRHGLEERHLVLSNAPHLARPLALVTPVKSWIEGLYFSIGLKMYDSFASGDTLPKSRWLGKSKLLEKVPTLNQKNIHSAVLYYDGQLDDARYCLALVQSASEAGAVVANYIEVTGFDKSDQKKITAVRARDQRSGQAISIKTKLVLNCTGPYADHIRLMGNPALTERIRPSKGVHMVLPYETLNSDFAMLIPKTSDGRVVFAIPFEGAMILGTTDTECEGLDSEPVLNAVEKQYLADTLNPYLEKKIDISTMTAGFGGLRPLLSAETNKSTKSLLRDHEVEIDAASGLVSLLGGKWTTYRLMAKDAVDQIDLIFNQRNDCTTHAHKLAGGAAYRYDDYKTLADKYNLPVDVCQHLMKKYGSRAEQVCLLTADKPDLKEKIVPAYSFIKAEVIYTIRNEMVITARDFLARRTRLEITDWRATLAALPQVIHLMGEELGWTTEQKEQEITAYQQIINKFMVAADMAV